MSVEETVSAILAPPSPAKIRAGLEQLFLKNIVGPEAGEDEELDIKTVRSVSDYYLVGMLAPMHRLIEMDDKDDLAVDGAGGADGQSPDISAPTARSSVALIGGDDLRGRGQPERHHAGRSLGSVREGDP